MKIEEKFHRALVKAGVYKNINCRTEIPHLHFPFEKIEVDNLAQMGDTIFVFEGKKWNIAEAIKQLKVRYKKLSDISFFLDRRIFDPYSKIRLFAYSLKKRDIVEYDKKGNEVAHYRFNDVRELPMILRNL